MAFHTLCFALFCVNLISMSPNLHDLNETFELLRNNTNVTVHKYKSLGNLLESNILIPIEVSMHDVTEKATKEALDSVNRLTEQAKSEGKNITLCLDAFEKQFMHSIETVVESHEPCLTDLENKYKDLLNYTQTGLKNSQELAAAVKVLPSNCNGREDEDEHQCFKTLLDTHNEKQHSLEELYNQHEEKYKVAVALVEGAIKCMENQEEHISSAVNHVAQETESCIKKQ